MFNPSRNDRWLFGSRETGRYLRRFAPHEELAPERIVAAVLGQSAGVTDGNRALFSDWGNGAIPAGRLGATQPAMYQAAGPGGRSGLNVR
jgi:hypothetical protein